MMTFLKVEEIDKPRRPAQKLTSPKTTQKKKYDDETVEENTFGETIKLTKGGPMGATSITTFTPGKPRAT